MRSIKAFSMRVLVGALLCSAILFCGRGLIAQNSRVAPRITADVDESSLITLHGNVPGLAQTTYDQGEASPATQLTNMRLVLSRTSAQEAALKQYLVQLQDKSSPNYHKWLTPVEFGQLYGPADADIAALVAWLQSQGLTVETVSKGAHEYRFQRFGEPGGRSLSPLDALLLGQWNPVLLEHHRSPRFPRLWRRW